MTIKFKKLSDKAVQPVRATNSGAGFNLTAARVTTEVNERGQIIIVYHSDIAIDLPEEYEAIVRPSNNICSKTLRMCNAPNAITGNINDEIVARFIATTDVVPAVYNEGDIFAQLVINKKEDIDFVEFIDTTESSADEGEQGLPETEGEPKNPVESQITSGGEENIPEEA